MMLKFEIGGSVNVICDRCGNNFTNAIFGMNLIWW